MPLDRFWLSEAEDLREKGERIGHAVEALRRVACGDQSVEAAEKAFLIILDGTLQALNLSYEAYCILDAAARVAAKPSAHPTGDPGAQDELDRAVEAYAYVSPDDLAADRGDFLYDMEKGA